MPPLNKAAKKAAKKVAKKATGQHDKRHQANDLRRAFEHMGRVTVLQQAAKAFETDAISELTTLAQKAIRDSHNRDAADLLRASEHLCFATFASGLSGADRVSAELKASITDQFDELIRKAEEHWEEADHSSAITGIYQNARSSATKAMKAGAYYEALEFARAAEAVAHVKQRDPLELDNGRAKLQLKSA